MCRYSGVKVSFLIILSVAEIELPPKPYQLLGDLYGSAEIGPEPDSLIQFGCDFSGITDR